ncbi:hypothetical protein DEA8626_01367 [Defluviimonas aquaemixtae]|uniref:Uncharacterized protein n=1 Tax=Albidovulum aquaemixtae TaxID=1542388 RepID=A0A2R8B5N7_9RHOB|nr:hypothetical protein DEA8626_01367 [Defluviimonas aquaemixtae]
MSPAARARCKAGSDGRVPVTMTPDCATAASRVRPIWPARQSGGAPSGPFERLAGLRPSSRCRLPADHSRRVRDHGRRAIGRERGPRLSGKCARDGLRVLRSCHGMWPYLGSALQPCRDVCLRAAAPCRPRRGTGLFRGAGREWDCGRLDRAGRADLDILQLSQSGRTGPRPSLAEVVATFGMPFAIIGDCAFHLHTRLSSLLSTSSGPAGSPLRRASPIPQSPSLAG